MNADHRIPMRTPIDYGLGLATSTTAALVYRLIDWEESARIKRLLHKVSFPLFLPVSYIIVYRYIYVHDHKPTIPCNRRYLIMSLFQTRFRSESVRRPCDRFLARSSRGSRSSASSIPPIPRARTLGSSAAAERVNPELGGSGGNVETLRSLRKVFVVLLLFRGDDSVLHSMLETYLRCLLLTHGSSPRCLLRSLPFYVQFDRHSLVFFGPCLPDRVPPANHAPATPFAVRARLADVPSVVFYVSPSGCWSIRCNLLINIIDVDQSLWSHHNQNPFDCTYQFVSNFQGSIRSECDNCYGQNPSMIRLED